MTIEELNIRFKERHPDLDLWYDEDTRSYENGTIVPFGKWNDQAIDLLLADLTYIDWIIAQPGMLADLQAKYPAFGKTFTEELLKEGYPVEYAPKRRPKKAPLSKESKPVRTQSSPAPSPQFLEFLKKARQKASKEVFKTAAIKKLYGEFAAIGLDPLALSVEDRREYANVLDFLRRQRTALEK